MRQQSTILEQKSQSGVTGCSNDANEIWHSAFVSAWSVWYSINIEWEIVSAATYYKENGSKNSYWPLILGTPLQSPDPPQGCCSSAWFSPSFENALLYIKCILLLFYLKFHCNEKLNTGIWFHKTIGLYQMVWLCPYIHAYLCHPYWCIKHAYTPISI